MIDFLMIERIKQNKGLAAFSCIFIVIFTLLGFWQIERGILKAELLDKFNIEQTQPPNDISNSSEAWSRVFVEGRYDPSQQTLIDNQINNGKVGYKIYTPFYYGDDQAIFVDRGWIPQGKTRNDIPDVDFKASKMLVTGSLIKPEKEVLAGDELLTNKWPMVSQTKSPEIIETAYKNKFFDKVLILEPGSKFMNEYIAIIPFSINSAKHFGYALQWFTMSIVLAGMFIYALKREL